MSITGATAVSDLCEALLDIVVDGLLEGERPLPIDVFTHHIPFVPQTACCTAPATDDAPQGFDGSLTASVASAFPAANFPAARSIGDPPEAPSRPSVHVWLRLWRCFTTLDEKGNYDTAAAAEKTAGIQEDLVVVWAALQRAVCQRTLSDVVAGCGQAILWEARPIRIQAGCAGWDFHLIATWIPLQFPPLEP